MTHNNASAVHIPGQSAIVPQPQSPNKTANSSSQLSQSSQSKQQSLSYTSLETTTNPATKDTLLVLFTLTLVSVMLFFTLYFWRKHRYRPLATLYKLEEYRYSRLSQNEMEVDSVVFYSDSLAPEQPHNEHNNVCNEVDNVKAATIHVETDSLITIPNCTSQVVANLKENSGKPKTTVTYDEMSDEDLLQ